MKNREVAYLQLLAVLNASNTPRGRKNLAEELRVGEGIVRTLLEGGREFGHVLVMKGGVKITEAGQTFLKDALDICGIGDVFAVEEAKGLLCGRRCMAHVVRGALGDVIKIRDSLVRLGACGALIIEKKGGKAYLPPIGEPLEKYHASLAKKLEDYVAQDASVVITCGDTFADALTPIELMCRESLRL
ncbi:MAG: DUF4443 domain-containing protein [Pyrobaculum sp.]|uniref:DUF4443 domain-containing protein n=1 Tax=Pyrobaculum sp. TaxID=2004705 RepID=UPI003CC1461F